MLKISFFLTVSLLMVATSLPVRAESEANSEAVEKSVPEVPKAQTPLDKLDQATKIMMDGLEENQLKQFAAIENSYRTMRAVDDVQMSIDRAVKACSDKNPELEEKMTTRFSSWKEVIRPVMKTADTKLNKMILLQSFAQPSAIRKYLKLFDAAVLYKNQSVKEVPVTEKKDCENLLDSMDDTQDNLVTLLTETMALDKPLKMSGEGL